ncbi:2-succinyl-6-hydroxy-2,4-cyclohexadiene-1-carboxylate synthase [Psychromonas sp. MB-3u-54]|uniref:2-succinyl-6-hydroxy-2, 4-cyclohexadiene-1-carboxylate synthase n=1 Tax=Psychromonas sp. MB-3u-54 TaxID=2058319 RepID=UPI000C33E941|nr:2-succinyl-6-hydroxy-2,4-cyclohexadiene-1-carboxylate synthase [Psychromonas sp. MB-3u-54]PKH01625.1 2-succinyl-6-hydroxy-2,4-cyclohexadiene-1-carboxylate synthase [Psychromonas sp. MB-3u-54]
MPLFSQTQGSPQSPALVFLHGFLGNHQDWCETIKQLKESFYCISIDLPGHGDSASVTIPIDKGFETTHRLIKNALDDLQIKEYILIGYSLGGRIALDYARTQRDENLKALILESCHTGYQTQDEKDQRFADDLNWAKRFATQSIIQSLNQWYEQDIFSDLSCEQKNNLINKRSRNYGVCLANMLLATSVAQQSDATPFLQNNATQANPLAIHYCFGEKDNKFKTLGRALTKLKNIHLTEFSEAGHNIHRQSPVQYARFIQQHFSQ